MNIAGYSQEAIQALAEYIWASDKCAREPDESYGAAFIAMEPFREGLHRFFSSGEIEAIIIKSSEIRQILIETGAGIE